MVKAPLNHKPDRQSGQPADLPGGLSVVSILTTRGVLILLRFYRYVVSPLLPPGCRFTPTCSQYMIEAIQAYGVVRGGLIGLKRISRCHPFAAGGDDPFSAHLERRHWFR
jgi:putative membrane protein insertion efficiency factor